VAERDAYADPDPPRHRLSPVEVLAIVAVVLAVMALVLLNILAGGGRPGGRPTRPCRAIR
jgi:hypothetical protein